MENTEKVCVVLGARSQLGDYLIPMLLRKGWRVVATSRTPPENQSDVEWVEADPVEDPKGTCEAVIRVAGQVDGVVNLLGAWMRGNPRAVLVNATLSMLEGLSPIASATRFVFCSGTGVYGHRPGETLNEDSEPRPNTSLGRLLLEAEEVVLGHESHLWSPIVLRFPHMWGKSDDRVMRAMLEGRFFVPGDGHNLTPHLHWVDAAKACAAALETDYSGIIHVADATQTTLREWCDHLADTAGVARLDSVSLEEAVRTNRATQLGPHLADPKLVEELFAVMTAEVVVDTSRMKTLLNLTLDVPDWRPTLTQLLKGIEL